MRCESNEMNAKSKKSSGRETLLGFVKYWIKLGLKDCYLVFLGWRTTIASCLFVWKVHVMLWGCKRAAFLDQDFGFWFLFVFVLHVDSERKRKISKKCRHLK